MTCSCHPKCVLMVQRSWFPDPEETLYRWAALAKLGSSDDHRNAAQHVLKAKNTPQAKKAAASSTNAPPS
eukprot:4831301-Heterocapsa_arctica.AAC.1